MSTSTSVASRTSALVVEIARAALPEAPPARPVEVPSAPQRMPHYPALDGLRGLAVVAVLLFHSGFTWARGGFLGVSTFFTLSGFLITGLLIFERRSTGRIDLRRFWARRMRRLLPAVFAAVALSALYGAFVSDADQLARLRGDGFAALGYVANWRFVFSGQAYSDLFAAPSPLLHMWSLAIEEQFYLVFPLLVAGVMWMGRRPLAALAVTLAALAGASLIASVLLADGGIDRVYYGTDTRAAEILLGALLAVGVARRGGLPVAGRRRGVVSAAGAIAIAATVVAWAVVGHESAWLYRGGFGAYALVTVVLIGAALGPGPVRRVLSVGPLRAVGSISYGLYLYHWPVFLWLSPGRTGLEPATLFAARIVVTFALALASYHLLEMPIRNGGLTWPRAHIVTPVAAVGLVAALLWVSAAPSPPAALAAFGAPTAAAPATLTSNTHPILDLRHATAADPLRVLMTGDSVAFDALPGITAALEATGEVTVHGGAMVGFGLTRTPDWSARLQLRLDDSQAELVVLMFGAWDTPYIAKHGRVAYAELVDEAVAQMVASGAQVLVIGMPASVTRDDEPLPRPADATFRELPARWPGQVGYVDAEPVLSPGGRYVDYLPGPDGAPERVRKLDGSHICAAGAARLGAAVVSLLAQGNELAASDSGWRSGDWALDSRYNDPPGACAA